ncbi:MAG: hypothetical protein JXA21_07900 [Anaerolineae bacterium]|nr:hypothetical protein [Anaerolineae bacterium]
MVSAKSLETWEAHLCPLVADIDLLGEIPLTFDECHALGQKFGQLMRRAGWGRGCDLIWEHYQVSFAVFLVAQGKQGYDAGAFWPGVRETTGLELSPPHTVEWGRLFEEIVEKLGVARFPDLGGHRYVGLILAHGGIPLNNLDEFFEQFLLPSVESPRYVALITTDYIEERLQRSSAHYTLSEPVLRFLLHGGSIAEDFVERCRQMAFQTAEGGTLPTAETAGLPEVVVASYCEWLEARGQISPKRRGRFRKPYLILEPWGWGPTLQLPRQEIAAQDVAEMVHWRVYADDVLSGEVPVDVRRMEFHWQTTEESFPLAQKATEYRVELCSVTDGSEEVRRAWCFPVLQADTPLLAFDPETRVFVPIAHHTLPAQRLWLLYSSAAQLTGVPPQTFQPDEALPSLAWDWAKFTGISVDLSQTQRLILQQDNQQQRINLETARQRGQPRLEGETLFPTTDGRAPLFIGQPPQVRIPLPEHNRQLQRWRVMLRNEWSATVEVDFAATLEELTESMLEIKDGVLVPLSAYLPAGAMGNYRATVRGPLGYAADLPFRLLPALEMVNHDALHWPDDQEALHLLVETSAQIVVEPQPGAQECTVTLLEQDAYTALYEVYSGLQNPQTPLRFILPRADHEAVIVPLTVPILRLRWLLALAPDQALAREWRTDALSLPLEALEQSLEPLLFVDLFGGALPDSEAELQLLDGAEEVLQAERARFPRGQPYARFDLRAFRDTLRHTLTPVSRVILCLIEQTTVDAPRCFPVLSVRRDFVVQDADALLQPAGEKAVLCLWWQTTLRLRRRFVRLWSLWRPWDMPLEFDLPDTADDECIIAAPVDFVYGRYRLEFGIRDPWVPTPAPEIPTSLEEAVSFTALLPRDAVFLRRKQLDAGETFSDKLERALLFQFSSNHKRARVDLDWCMQHLDESTLPQILTLAQAVNTESDLAMGLRIKLARLAHVKRFWAVSRGDETTQRLFRRYLALLPKFPVETCEFLITLDDNGWRLKALRELLAYGAESGVRALVRWLQAAQMAEDDAIGLLESFFMLEDNTQASERITLLTCEIRGNLDHPAVLRMMERLGRRHPKLLPAVLIRPGDWIRTLAGWGRIEQIQNAAGEVVPSFRVTTSAVRLLVTLRAENPTHSEHVEVDLAEGVINFSTADELYTCSKCHRFTTQYQVNLHEHNRLTHDPGMGAAFSPQQNRRLKFYSPPSFTCVPPDNSWE